jgi:predicted acylesterase/phospholipase RssA
MQQFSSIVIAGGAVKVLSTIGCLKYLEEHNMTGSIKNYVGTSAGAIMCLFMILGYKSIEIVEFMKEALKDNIISTFDMSKVFNFISDYGISDGSNLVEMLERILYKKMRQKDINFMDLAKKIGKHLVICVANLSDEQVEFFSVDTCPHMSIITAIKASCAVPFIFTPVKVNDKLYVDGGMYNNFAIDYFKDHRLKDILGLNIRQKNYQNTSDIISYSIFIINSLINRVNKKNYDDISRNIVTIDIEDNDCFSFNTLTLNITTEIFQSYMTLGYDLIKAKMTTTIPASITSAS